jgi:hypothetical protein
MKTIQTTAMIGADRKLVVELPADVPPGTHEVVIVIAAAGGAPFGPPPERPHPKWPSHELGRWPYSATLRREEFYGDEAR